MLGSAERGKVRQIAVKLFFKNSNLYDHECLNVTSGRTDRRTDNLPWQYRAPLRLRAVKRVKFFSATQCRVVSLRMTTIGL